MKSKNWVNPFLGILLLAGAALCWFLPKRDVTRPNYEFLPEAQMAQSPSFDSFTPNPNFPDGATLRTPPEGTLPRGYPRLPYQPTLQDAVRAGLELKSPFRPNDKAHQERGSVIFTNFCQVCHGPLGQGNGTVTQGGFPPPASLLADRAVQMKDGQLFHVLTYGQGNMPSFSTQLSRDDRWSAILYIRLLQGQSVSPVPSSTRFQEVAKLFGQNCSACHGEDGKGNAIRSILPLIPDFTSLAWQMSQPEISLVNQIDYGSAPFMPGFRYRLTREQVLGLAVYIRSFPARQPGGQPSTLPPPSRLTAKNVYGTFCFACHDTNGKGNPVIRVSMPELPDFTVMTWQKSRSDADLTHSILEGKGKFMLPMKDKLGTVDASQMVALVRGFEGGKQIVEVEGPKPEGPPLTPVGDASIIGKTIPEISSPVLPRGIESEIAMAFGSLSAPFGFGPFFAASSLLRGGSVVTARPDRKITEEEAARIRAGATIFRQYCMVCHGPDGTGSLMRLSMPTIPNWTTEAFQKQRNDSEIRVSILDGKGVLMPANRGRVTEDQARDLVAYVRSFGPPVMGLKPDVSDAEFEKALRLLELQLDDLHKEMQKVKGKK